ncbi:unnamed protein product [Scytosiphon promiscuus]
MYHHFHKHRYELEQTGEWSFVPPSVKRKWRHAAKKTDKVERLREYMAMRRDRFLRIRGLCRQIRSIHGKSSDLIVSVMPESLVDENLLKVAGGGKRRKTAGMFGRTRLKKCHWQSIDSKGEQCTCTNYRMEHPHRLFKDEFGVLIHDTLATCGWHATRCVSNAHGEDPAVISTANEGALCNECLVTKGPIRNTTAFGAPGVRFKNKRVGSADTDPGAAGEEFLAWNKWFTKGPGRARKGVMRPRHPQAPPGMPPAGLRPPAIFVPPPPPPPVFSMANFRRQKTLAKWRLRKEEKATRSATAIQRTYRGYRARHLRAMVALEHPMRAQLRVESSIVMQSLVRRFLGRTLVLQIAAFRNVNATAIQRMARGMQARALFRRKRAQAIVQRQMLFFLTRAFVASAKVAKKIREEMRKKHAVALSLQRAWRGKKGREKAAMLRATRLRRHGAAITTQQMWRCVLAKRELAARQHAHRQEIRAAIILQSLLRMFFDRRRVEKLKLEFDTAARRLQPMVRGLLARAAARRERALLGQVWSWLGTDTITANDTYARFLPKSRYGVSEAEEELQRSCSLPHSASGGVLEDRDESREESGTASSMARMSLDTLAGERHFTTKFDTDRAGTCSKVEFKLGLESFLREQGYPLQKEEAALIVKRFFDGDGFCAWYSFLKAYHAGSSAKGAGSACTRHGRLLCTLCIRSKQLGFKMCQCGHVFDAHALALGGSKAGNGQAPRQQHKHKSGWVLPQKKQLNTLLSKGLPKTAVDRPVNVEGCSAATNLQAHRGATFPGGAGARAKTPPAASTKGVFSRELPCRRIPRRRRKRSPTSIAAEEIVLDREGVGVTGLSLAELSPPFFGKRGTASNGGDPRTAYTPRNDACHWKENAAVRPERQGMSQGKKNAYLPTLREAKLKEQERRDASWAGRQGQVERAALAEMSSTVQGKNAAEYAARLQDDIATNISVVDGRLSLAPVMSKKELKQGFSISAAVPFVTTDPVGLYLYLLKALSDERHELLRDERRFTDFVARHAVFLERHWCKIVKDMRNGSLDAHLPIADGKRKRIEGLMIPNKKRAQRLDDRLRVLGFHARASGIFNTGASASPVRETRGVVSPPSAAHGQGMKQPPSAGDNESGVRGEGRRGASAGGRTPLTQEEQQESMAKKVEASKRRRPGTEGTESDGIGRSVRRKRRTVTGGEMESEARLVKLREGSRARSPSAGAVQAIPTPEQASKTAYELLTAASANAAGVIEAKSGRGVCRYVCMHPGCGKVFHLKASAADHQKKEHRFRKRLAAPTPLTDQFMSASWPSDGVPWVPGSSSSRPLLPFGKSRGKNAPHGTLKATSSPKKRTGSAGGGKGEGSREKRGGGGRMSNSQAPSLGHDDSSLQARFTCGVPGCEHRFPEARLLGLHLRMGHSEFDLDRMKAAKEGTEPTSTLDGISATASIDVGGNLRASFLGTYRLVPPFQPPTGCRDILTCDLHGRLKHGCRRCEEITQLAAAAGSAGVPENDRAPLGLPLPPAKFYTRAMVVVVHNGRPVKLDLDCSQTLRCPLLRFPPSRAPSVECIPADDDEQDQAESAAEDGVPGCSDGTAVGQPTRQDSCSTKIDQTATTAVVDVGIDAANQDDDEEDVRCVLSPRRRKFDENNERGSSDNERQQQRQQQEPQGQLSDQRHPRHPDRQRKQRGALVPARLVALLVDGSGKGWMAARRLWSVHEVGFPALTKAGLAMRDIDQDQEFLVGTEVEYLPLSLVWDTCTIKIDRRDDVHSKQRLGALPTPLRYVSHGVDSATGDILVDSEVKLREKRLDQGR